MNFSIVWLLLLGAGMHWYIFLAHFPVTNFINVLMVYTGQFNIVTSLVKQFNSKKRAKWTSALLLGAGAIVGSEMGTFSKAHKDHFWFRKHPGQEETWSLVLSLLQNAELISHPSHTSFFISVFSLHLVVFIQEKNVLQWQYWESFHFSLNVNLSLFAS